MSLWKRPIGKQYADLADAWSGDPPDSAWAKWFGGVVCPLLPLWGAINCWLSQQGFIPGQGGSRFELAGTQAIVLGFLLFGIASFFHFHYFWGNSRKLEPFMDFGKTASGILAVGCILYLYWFMGVECFSC